MGPDIRPSQQGSVCSLPTLGLRFEEPEPLCCFLFGCLPALPSQASASPSPAGLLFPFCSSTSPSRAWLPPHLAPYPCPTAGAEVGGPLSHRPALGRPSRPITGTSPLPGLIVTEDIVSGRAPGTACGFPDELAGQIGIVGPEGWSGKNQSLRGTASVSPARQTTSWGPSQPGRGDPCSGTTPEGCLCSLQPLAGSSSAQ